MYGKTLGNKVVILTHVDNVASLLLPSFTALKGLVLSKAIQ